MSGQAEYARAMLAVAGVSDPRVEAAFAVVPREDFLGKPPWTVVDPVSGMTEAVSDPAAIRRDVLLVLDGGKGVNNGSPSLHALMLHHLGVVPGDRVLHVGIGGGYYTAMLAELAGPSGTVAAVEFDAALAAAARGNLAAWANVAVVQEDGAKWPQAATDRIYVNFGVGDPLAAPWLDWLTEGGTLVFPLAVPRPGRRATAGAVFAVTRTGTGFSVRHLSPCGFIGAEGPLAGSPDLQQRLNAAFGRGGSEFVQSLRLGQASPERCFFWSPAWCLSYDPPPGA